MYVDRFGAKSNNGVKFTCFLHPQDNSIIAKTFRKWVSGCSTVPEARLAIFNHVNRMPFGLKGLGGRRNEPNAETFLLSGSDRASCLYKTELMAVMLKIIGHEVVYRVGQIQWECIFDQIPGAEKLAEMARENRAYTLHSFFAIRLRQGGLVEADPSFDPELVQHGFPNGIDWDGCATFLPEINFSKPPQTYESRASFLSYVHKAILENEPSKSIPFIIAFNKILDQIRSGKAPV